MFSLMQFLKFVAYAEHIVLDRNIYKVAKLYTIAVLSLCFMLSMIITFCIGHC